MISASTPPLNGYGWKGQERSKDEPDADANAETILGPYFRRLRLTPRSVEPSVFESVVELWLRDLVDGAQVPGPEWSTVFSPSLEGAELVVQAP